MFDWQADIQTQSSNPNEGTKVVSPRFWIYWVISVPLTVLVLLTWRTWWHREKRHYRLKYPHVKLDSNVPDMDWNVFKRMSEMMSLRKKLKDTEEGGNTIMSIQLDTLRQDGSAST